MSSSDSSPRIRYDEGCLAAHALNLIGDRWALIVVRELMFSAKRFQMIRAGIPGVTASVLTGRLEQLERAGVVRRDGKLGIYALTDAGRGLLPVLESLCRWALTVPGHDPQRFISPSALMISMGIALVPSRTWGRSALAGFDFGAESFEIRLLDGRLHTQAVETPEATFVLSGTGNSLAAAVYGKVPLAVLVDTGTVNLAGPVDAAQEFVDFFQLAHRE